MTSALHRLFGHVIRLRLQAWAEKVVLGQLQIGFRPGHCLGNNLFVMTQTIEIVVKEDCPLLFVFHDTSEAYDSIEQARLSQPLQALCIQEELLCLLLDHYTDTQVVVQ